MRLATVVDAQHGTPLLDHPASFVRIPCIGEMISLPLGIFLVVDVVHHWEEDGSAAVQLRVNPRQ